MACPTCGNPHVSVVLRSIYCHKCVTLVDPIVFASRVAGASILATVKKLEGLGAFPSKMTCREDTLRGYLAHANARIAFDRLASAMRDRKIASVTGSSAHAHYRLSDRAHDAAGRYWCTTVGELDAYVRGHLTRAGSIPHILSSTLDRVLLVIPHYNEFQLVGLTVFDDYNEPFADHPAYRYLSCAGHDGGVSNHVLSSYRGGTARLLRMTLDADVYMKNVFHNNNSTTEQQYILYGGNPTSRLIQLLGEETIAVDVSDRSKSLQALLLAARHDLMVVDARGLPIRWETAFVGLQSYEISGRVSDVARAWSHGVAERAVASGWVTRDQSRGLVASIAKAAGAVRESAHRAIPIRRGFTVDASGTTWTWVEKQILLTSAIPVVDRVYRDEQRRIRYKGYVLYGNDTYPFDSRRFRADPAAVIESAVVKRGRAAPIIHPAIVPHLADIALYVSGRS